MMRIISLLLFFFLAQSPIRAGQIIVYNQVWRGTAMNYSTETRRGKGYILLDLTNHKLTRISTSILRYSTQKIYYIESFGAPTISEPGSGPATKMMVINGAEFVNQFGTSTQTTLFMKGKEVLATIGPSQQIQAPKSVTGIFKRSLSQSSNHVDEDSFSGILNSSITNDTNGNSRTLDAEVALLIESLKAAGHMTWSR